MLFLRHLKIYVLLVNENIDFKRIINEWNIVKIITYQEFGAIEWSGNAEIIRKIESKKERKDIIKKTIEQKKQQLLEDRKSTRLNSSHQI